MVVAEGGVAAPARLLDTVAPAARAPAAALGAGVGCHLATPGSKATVERTNFKRHVNKEMGLCKMHKIKFLGKKFHLVS